MQGYVDDVSLIAKSERELAIMAEKTEAFMSSSGMNIKHRKCAILHGHRTGNNWNKNNTTGQTEVMLQNEKIPMYARNQTYTYLGYEIGIDNNNEQVNKLKDDFLETLDKIDQSLLPSSAKLEAINVVLMSKLVFYFSNLLLHEKDLKVFEDNIVSYARHWLGLNSSSTRAYFFTPKSRGGLGVMNPRIMYYAKFLSFHLSVLNSDDEVVRTTARHSLELHLSKRKINQTQERSGSFAGYELDDNGNLKKHSKVNWTKSVWCHLHAMCRRENISVQSEGNMFFYSISLDENLTVKVKNSHAFYSVYKQRQLQRL